MLRWIWLFSLISPPWSGKNERHEVMCRKVVSKSENRSESKRKETEYLQSVPSSRHKVPRGSIRSCSSYFKIKSTQPRVEDEGVGILRICTGNRFKTRTRRKWKLCRILFMRQHNLISQKWCLFRLWGGASWSIRENGVLKRLRATLQPRIESHLILWYSIDFRLKSFSLVA